jgi:hypothetical protein
MASIAAACIQSSVCFLWLLLYVIKQAVVHAWQAISVLLLVLLLSSCLALLADTQQRCQQICHKLPQC